MKDITPGKRSAVATEDSKWRVSGLRLGTLAVAAGSMYLIYTLVWYMVSAAVGAGILAVIGLAGIALFQSLGLLGQKLDNRLLRARMQEAAENPIEQLNNELIRRTLMVQVFRDALVDIGGQVQDMRDDVASKKMADKRSGRTTDLSKQEASIVKMQQFMDNRKRKLAEASTALDDYRAEIDNATFDWNFQIKANKAYAAMNATDKNSMMEEMLSNAALTSVREKYNRIFAELDIDAAEINNTKTLSFDGQVIDVSKISIPQPELVTVGN